MGDSILGKPFAEVAKQLDKLAYIQCVYRTIRVQPTSYIDNSNRNSEQAKINAEIFHMLKQNKSDLERLMK